MVMLKMAYQGRSGFNVVFTMSLCALGLKQLLISLLFQIKRMRNVGSGANQPPKSFIPDLNKLITPLLNSLKIT